MQVWGNMLKYRPLKHPFVSINEVRGIFKERFVESFVALPNSMIAFIVFVILILVAFGFKLLFIHQNSTQTPATMRKKGIQSKDGHLSWTLYEQNIEMWLIAQGVPHEKPQSAYMGEYYSNSQAVPFFIVFTSPKKEKIDSVIYLKDLERPASFVPLIRTPNSKSVYPECLISFSELVNNEWPSLLYSFYKDLRKRNKKRKNPPNQTEEEKSEFNNPPEET
jgi:hypothetical protein